MPDVLPLAYFNHLYESVFNFSINMKSAISILGFILFISGFLSLVLMLVGVKLAPLLWIDAWGGLPGLIIRLAMILTGILMVYLTRIDWKN